VDVLFFCVYQFVVVAGFMLSPNFFFLATFVKLKIFQIWWSTIEMFYSLVSSES
jgi:hypothetical protein